jgi:peptidyl-prolyl cis-trans isomerase D
VLRVEEHRPPAAQPLDAVRDEITARLSEQQAAEAALARAEAMVDELRKGASLEEAAGDAEVMRPGLVGRTAPGVPPAVLRLAFTAARPGDDGASYASGAAADGDGLVVAVSRVEDGSADAQDTPQMRAEAQVLSQALARSGMTSVMEDLQSRAKIERKPLEATDQF